MITVTELKRWLDTLGAGNSIGVGDGGLTLVEVPKGSTVTTGAYLEVGGLPMDDQEPEECASCGRTVEDDGAERFCPACGLVYSA